MSFMFEHYFEDDKANITNGELKRLTNPETTRWKKISPANIYECEQCGINLMTNDIEVYKYCHNCGRKVR